MKRFAIFAVLAALLSSPALALAPAGEEAVSISVPSAVLMEKTTGEVIYEKDAHQPGAPASVTKVMTMLLVMEEIAAGRLSKEDVVVCSSRAASMGGSQIWLEEGEQMSVHELFKAVAVVSANDCAVALAEHIAGSEEGFVAKMNRRAEELGMENTHFVDCTGLTEDESHLTTAYDIALMSRELILHEDVKEYTTIWMDSLRDGAAELVNTNKLVRFYKGTTGLKTGFTRRAMYCLSATAQRDGMELISVVLHGATTGDRFESAKALLNFGFANYAVCPLRAPEALPPIRVSLGTADSVQPVYSGREGMLLEKGGLGELHYEICLPDCIAAPVAEGEAIGELAVYSGKTELARLPLLAGSRVDRLGFFHLYGKLVLSLFGG
jgi:D-alanyl-D-alanine carboxypeptidase (penicillin-binding protein 5/6)